MDAVALPGGVEHSAVAGPEGAVMLDVFSARPRGLSASGAGVKEGHVESDQLQQHLVEPLERRVDLRRGSVAPKHEVRAVELLAEPVLLRRLDRAALFPVDPGCTRRSELSRCGRPSATARWSSARRVRDRRPTARSHRRARGSWRTSELQRAGVARATPRAYAPLPSRSASRPAPASTRGSWRPALAGPSAMSAMPESIAAERKP